MHKVTNVSDTSQEFYEKLPQGGFGHVRLAPSESIDAEIDVRQPRFSSKDAPLRAEEITAPAPAPAPASDVEVEVEVEVEPLAADPAPVAEAPKADAKAKAPKADA